MIAEAKKRGPGVNEFSEEKKKPGRKRMHEAAKRSGKLICKSPVPFNSLRASKPTGGGPSHLAR
jgi:hypothetical protein